MLITQAKEKCLASCKGINLDFLNKLYLAPLRILSMSWFVPSLNVRKVCNTPPPPPPKKKKYPKGPQSHFSEIHVFFLWKHYKLAWKTLGPETSFMIKHVQNQPSRGFLRKRCSENIQQIRNHTSAWVFSCKFAAYFQKTFS